MNFTKVFSTSMRNAVSILNEVSLNLYISFGNRYGHSDNTGLAYPGIGDILSFFVILSSLSNYYGFHY